MSFAFSLFKESLKRTRNILVLGVDFILPPLCVGCETPITRAHALCADCWAKIRFISDPFCACCGFPFDYPMGEGALCGKCLSEPPSYDMVRSAVIYDEESRGMILRLKHADQTHLHVVLAGWMTRCGQEALTGCDAVLPVPLHRWRLLKRRYNQSALLASAIAKQTGLSYWPDALLRVKATDSQKDKGEKARRANVAKAFAVNPRFDVSGQTLVLIDDVFTSGATVSECARVLKKAGAASVRVITLARVARL
ncbi:MAG: ComF family protein [Alphaproteobacteria bacterium]|jgi:ComF family protein|nr:ComF family protein [Alphaproteobacteria bacterium]